MPGNIGESLSCASDCNDGTAKLIFDDNGKQSPLDSFPPMICPCPRGPDINLINPPKQSVTYLPELCRFCLKITHFLCNWLIEPHDQIKKEQVAYIVQWKRTIFHHFLHM